MAYAGKPYKRVRTFPLPRAKVWELLADTDHLNRFIGLFALRASPVQTGAKGMFRELAAKVGGIVPLRWKEYPFEWEKESFYAVLREYGSGPLRSFYGGVRLRDVAGGTEVELFATFTPANALAFVAIPLTGKRAMVRTMLYLDEYLRMNAAGTPVEKRPQMKRSYALRSGPLERWAGELGEEERGIAAKLCDHLAVSDDDGVVDMRPYALAKMWSEDRERTLRLFLHATRAGIANLSWNLICPNCRVSKEQTTTLSKLQPKFHCDFCGIAYEANFDRFVELTFTVHPAIREAFKSVYCVGGPMITPHIAAQKVLEPGQTAEVGMPVDAMSAGCLRLRTLQANRMLEAPAAGRTYRYTGAGWEEAAALGGGHPDGRADGTLQLRNDSAQPIVAVLELTDWMDEAVTAAQVTTMHEFRSWFSSEVLAPGEQVGVESVTLLFSDLLGSTAFYEQVGDAPAYGQVRRHFDFMLEWIRTNSGTLVKTIGDAVMAVFPEPRFGMRAALDIQLRVEEFNRRYPSETPIAIKIGLHHGPAIVVNSNGLLDYFGRTVNIAAHIQAQGAGGDVIVSEESAADPHVQWLLREAGVVTERFSSKLKGIDEQVALLRVRPAASYFPILENGL